MDENKQVASEKIDLIDDYYDDYLQAISNVNEQSILDDFMRSVMRRGTSKLLNQTTIEHKTFDFSWVESIEKYLPSIDKIFRNPKSQLAYDDEIIAVEKAKKINAESIRHLSKHTHFIKEIKEDGDIIPSKILTKMANDSFLTYENRFAVSLLKRIFKFINVRKEALVKDSKPHKIDTLKDEKVFKIKNSEITYNLSFQIKSPSRAKNNKIDEVLSRIEKLENMIAVYRGTTLYRSLEHATEVRSPIMKTNIILKNADFKNAHTLWLLLERYNTLGFDVDVEMINPRPSEELINDLEQISTLTFAAFMHHRERHNLRFNNRLRYRNRKLKRPEEILESDIAYAPGVIKFEDYSVSEYFYEATKKYYEKEAQVLLNDGASYEVALQSIYKQMLNITNFLYRDLFQAYGNNDDFFKNIEQHDINKLRKELQTETKKLNILTDVYKVKKEDLNDLEKEISSQRVKIAQIESAINCLKIKDTVALKEKELRKSLNEEKIRLNQKLKEEERIKNLKENETKRLEKVRQIYEERLNRNLQQLENRYNRLTEKQTAHTREKIEELHFSNNDLEATIKALKEELALQKKANQEALVLANDEYQSQLEALKADMEAEINALKEQLALDRENLEEEIDRLNEELDLDNAALEEEKRNLSLNLENEEKLAKEYSKTQKELLEYHAFLEKMNQDEKIIALEEKIKKVKNEILITTNKTIKVIKTNEEKAKLIDSYTNLMNDDEVKRINIINRFEKRKQPFCVVVKKDSDKLRLESYFKKN